MIQVVRLEVVHEIADCPAANPAQLEQLLGNLRGLHERMKRISGGQVRITADWYNRNSHTFNFLCELEDVRIAVAKDYLKQTLGLSDVSVREYATENAEQAIEVLEAKLAQAKPSVHAA